MAETLGNCAKVIGLTAEESSSLATYLNNLDELERALAEDTGALMHCGLAPNQLRDLYRIRLAAYGY
jgi:hypothetical protein